MAWSKYQERVYQEILRDLDDLPTPGLRRQLSSCQEALIRSDEFRRGRGWRQSVLEMLGVASILAVVGVAVHVIVAMPIPDKVALAVAIPVLGSFVLLDRSHDKLVAECEALRELLNRRQNDAADGT